MLYRQIEASDLINARKARHIQPGFKQKLCGLEKLSSGSAKCVTDGCE
jgi:hypothetical protein